MIQPKHFADRRSWWVVWALPCFGIVSVVWIASFLIVWCAFSGGARPRPQGPKLYVWAVNGLFFSTLFVIGPLMILAMAAWSLLFCLVIGPIHYLGRLITGKDTAHRGKFHPATMVNRILFPSVDALTTPPDPELGDEDNVKATVANANEENKALSPLSQPIRSRAASAREQSPEHDIGSLSDAKDPGSQLPSLQPIFIPTRWDQEDGRRKTVHFVPETSTSLRIEASSPPSSLRSDTSR